MAAGYQVLPRGSSSPRPGYYVVERQLARGQHFPAELTSVAIPQQNVLARESARLVRNAAIFEQPDHGRQANGETGGMEKVSVLFLCHCDPLQHQDDSTARRADVNRFVRSIQHQHRRMQHVRTFALGTHGCYQWGGHVSPSHAAHRIVPLPRHSFLEPPSFARSDSRGSSVPTCLYPAAAIVSRASVSVSRIACWASVFNVRATVAT